MNIIYWGKYISFHQLETLQRVRTDTGCSIKYVLSDVVNKTRANQGWKPSNIDANDLIELPNKQYLKSAFQVVQKNKDAFHLFLSFWGDKRLFFILLYAVLNKVKVAVLFEPYSVVPYGLWNEENIIISYIKIFLRRVLYRLLGLFLRLISNNSICVFAVSLIARDQLIKAGFDERVVFPYGYFVHKSFEGVRKQKKQNNQLRLIYAGSLLKIKGLDLLLSAIKYINLSKTKILLDIYGSGEINRFLDEGLTGVSYKGRYLPENAQKIVSEYDALLLPSRHDGWGVVVNEALLQGVPVILSSHVGAKCLIETNNAGLVFESDDIKSLLETLNKLIEYPDKLQLMSECAFEISGRIFPEIGAQYFVDVLRYHFYGKGCRPHPLWLKKLFSKSL